MEIGDAHGNKQGNYHIIDTDGRARRVDYIADKGGFRAVVKTNEPGTARSAPAGVVIDSPYEGPVAPEVPVVVAQPPATVVVEPVAHPVAQEPVAVPPPVVQEPISVPVVQQPVAVPSPVIVQPVAHPAPVSTIFTVRHTVPAVQRPLIPTRGIVVNHGLYNFGGLSYSSGIVGLNPLKGYPFIR
ncbi:unnamed protein product [Larinioides sclopetarius]|uniref:Cuticle protein n=1 Tax=Larinioides sclopetarius TaxID=280406 RepID=A0AAV1Z2P7_9ARAC